jgi:hypothetical protein
MAKLFGVPPLGGISKTLHLCFRPAVAGRDSKRLVMYSCLRSTSIAILAKKYFS